MRRIALIFNLIMLLSAGSLSAQKTTLSGTLKGVPDGYHAIVSKVVGDKFVPVDTLQLNKKNAFKVIIFVADASGEQIISLQNELVSFAVQSLDLYVTGTVNFTCLTGNRKAAFTANL